MIRAWGSQHKLTRKAYLAPSWAWNEFNDSQAQGWNQARGEKSILQGSEPTRNLGQNFQNVFRLGRTGKWSRQAASSSHQSLARAAPVLISQHFPDCKSVACCPSKFARPVSHVWPEQCGAHSHPSLTSLLKQMFPACHSESSKKSQDW